MTIEEALQKYFGYDNFRIGQKETIESILSGQDTFAILPTGMGKSLCYQLPSYLLEPGITVIISPLLSLMYDQVQQIQKRGEKKVIALTSELSSFEKKHILKYLKSYRYLFLSPEMLLQEEIIKKLKQINISLFVIDEAHCILQWGVDFRPEYLQVGQVLEKLNYPLTLALTATVTQSDREEISDLIFKTKPKYITTSVNRKNLYYQVEILENKDEYLEQFVRKFKGPGVIYFSSKKQADRIALLLKNKLNLRVASYHADLTNRERKSIQDQFINDKLEILCATTAFGMGVNKGNIRFVIHYHMPASIEAFLQESGRAGRDGKPALSLLLYQEGDEALPQMMLKDTWQEYKQLEFISKESDLSILSELQQKWYHLKQEKGKFQGLMESKYQIKQQQILQVKKYIDEKECRRTNLLAYFDEQNEHDESFCCDLMKIDLIKILNLREDEEIAEKFDYHAKIRQLFQINSEN